MWRTRTLFVYYVNDKFFHIGKGEYLYFLLRLSIFFRSNLLSQMMEENKFQFRYSNYSLIQFYFKNNFRKIILKIPRLDLLLFFSHRIDQL